ncbi:hypothetical protein ES703_50939 [subsurface metagenome]
MINDETARSMGVKFLRENGAGGIAGKLERDTNVCLEDVFAAVEKKFGKKGVKKLLLLLPQRLRNYVYYECLGRPDKPFKFGDALEDLYNNRPESYGERFRPERLKEFDSWMAKVEKTIMRYLDGEL